LLPVSVGFSLHKKQAHRRPGYAKGRQQEKEKFIAKCKQSMNVYALM
jgi:hypothetical protein